MKKEFCVSGVDDKFRLLFAADGIRRTDTAEEMYDRCAYEDESIDEYCDMYEKEVCAAYKSNNGNIMVFRGFGDPMVRNGEPPTIDSMIDFVVDFDPLADELNEDNKLIIYVTELNGSGTHYDRIYDNRLYNKLLNMDGIGIIYEVMSYERKARPRSGHAYDMAIIKDGEYTFSIDPDEIDRLFAEMKE